MLTRFDPGPLPESAEGKALKRLAGRLKEGMPVVGASRVVTSSGPVLDSDDLLLVATAGGAVTLMLPPASQNLGRQWAFKKMDAHANNLTVDAAETIDGAASVVFNTQYQVVRVQAVQTSDAPPVANYVTV
jgi:hypothetical protein